MEENAIILKPIITERSTQAAALGKYIFVVAQESNKHQIKSAIERKFKVKVKKVNIISVPGKERKRGRIIGQTKSWKKAIVTLIPGDKIEIFEGV